jgi:hypothetical protein
MNTRPEPRTYTQFVAHGIIWIGAIIAASIVISIPGDHSIIIPILVACAVTSLGIIADKPKTGSRVVSETREHDNRNA